MKQRIRRLLLKLHLNPELHLNLKLHLRSIMNLSLRRIHLQIHLQIHLHHRSVYRHRSHSSWQQEKAGTLHLNPEQMSVILK